MTTTPQTRIAGPLPQRPFPFPLVAGTTQAVTIVLPISRTAIPTTLMIARPTPGCTAMEHDVFTLRHDLQVL